ncbi:9811_t:CDS:2 [Entrophospora sp. SA101]|nr:9811_t:CDS:2 [Entrophospora sp. SA101]
MEVAKIDSCEQYITQTKKTVDVNFPFIGLFSPNENEQDDAQSRESPDAFIGVDSMKPWGIIRNGCCGIRRFKKHTVIKLEEFVNVPSTNANLEIISRAARDLEGFRHFLESNVIDTSLLEALRSQQQQQSQEQQQQRVEIETQQNNKS